MGYVKWFYSKNKDILIKKLKSEQISTSYFMGILVGKGLSWKTSFEMAERIKYSNKKT